MGLYDVQTILVLSMVSIQNLINCWGVAVGSEIEEGDQFSVVVSELSWSQQMAV